jgi:beta-lactamase regulating signal transducer with metallopeptidase domain
MFAAWLLTYLLHSTLFLGLAWLLARGPLRRRPALEEAVWRFALVAALVTASVQLASGREPLAGRWGLKAGAPSPAAVSSVIAPHSVAAPAVAPILVERAAPFAYAESPIPQGIPVRPARPFPWQALIAGLWAVGALALGARWVAAHAALHRRLRSRPEVVGGDMHGLLRQLAGEAGLPGPVRLTVSSRLPVPIALGLRRREICVPPRALAALAAEEQQGLLAHELAHLVRRDPFWLAFSSFLASVLFFQPLNQAARRRLREISELRSDEWAVGQTGRPVSLARCLAEVAGWSIQPLGSLVAPGMADRPSHLAHRIRRLLDSAGSPERRVRPLWLAAGMAALLIVVSAAAPGVTAAGAKAGAPGSAAPVLAGAKAGVPGSAAPVLAAAPRGHGPKLAGTPVPEHDSDMEDREDMEEAGDAVDPEIDVDLLDLDIDLPDLDAVLADLPDLGELDAHLANLDAIGEHRELTEEEEKALEEHLDTLNDEIENRLKPQMEELERKLEKQMEGFEKSPAMQRLRAQTDEIARRSRPSQEELDRIRAQAEKMRADGRMTEEERARLRDEARKMHEHYRLSDKDHAEMRELSRQAREESQRFMHEHQAEMDAMRQQLQEQATAIREEVQRKMESDPELRALRERHRSEADKKRQEMRKRRQEERDRRDKEHGDGDGKHHSGRISGAALRQSVEGGVRGGISGGVLGGVEGGVQGGVEGGVQGGVAGGVPGGR